MAAATGSLWSRISLCSRANSALNSHQNTTAFNRSLYRQYVSSVTQSAAFLMKQQGKRRKYNEKPEKVQHWRAKNPYGAVRLKIDTIDWPSVFTGAQSYNPATIPIFFRMGRMKQNKPGFRLPRKAQGNLELMKVPNFFHLTPPAIERHCEALKPLCSEWPHTLDLSSVPLRVTTKNYLFAGPSLYHPGSRIVKLQVYLKDLVLDDHSRKKLIELAEDRYDPETEELTIVTDRCPTRKQNRDYAMYLLTVLYHESWKTEPWETEASNEEEESDDEDDEILETKKKRRKNPKRLKLVDGVLYRVNQYGKYFKLFINEKF
ncbi:28S ribosomal protein S35, mitochondrial [Desmophyllum pertusum]|uniref:28S ribosomal protein S35, mitochondrial n=1 Tax=Desmophyllum pertusum TaxID=174260 RepID=A0A9X0D3M4_9CNID|nr:28S ribosomal protein S35, mitochondrial [Desmophyllum pertusum]